MILLKNIHARPFAHAIFVAWLLLLGLSACSEEKGQSIRDYYFPVLDLQQGKVYAYDLVDSDSTAPEYWYFRTFVRDSGVYFASTYYDANFQIGQILREKIVKTGAVARDFYLYSSNPSNGRQIQTKAKLEGISLFPFRITDSAGVYLFSLRYNPAYDPTSTVVLIRKRKFLGKGQPFKFNGETYPTIRFGLRESISNDADGAPEIEGIGEEWYAKGLGLVYYRKQYGRKAQVKFAYRLQEIFDMEELEWRAGGQTRPGE